MKNILVYIQALRKDSSRLLSFHFCIAICFTLLVACKEEKTDPAKFKVYTGPLMEVDSVETWYSDSARLKIKMTAPKQLLLESGDRDFPKGVYVIFYDETGKIVNATLQGNHGHFSKEKNMYTVTGNVIVVNKKENSTVNTEELNWSQITRKIYTDRFVTIQTPNEILKGEGLDAEQDFSRYSIRKPTGIFSVEK